MSLILPCLTTLGFGDIAPVQPLAQMAAVTTSVAGTLYVVAVMGILIGRYGTGVTDRSEE